jgi:Flp pilus assembly CpaF family ATPase
MADSVKSIIVGWAERSDRLLSDLTMKPIAARVDANDPFRTAKNPDGVRFRSQG